MRRTSSVAGEGAAVWPNAEIANAKNVSVNDKKSTRCHRPTPPNNMTTRLCGESFDCDLRLSRCTGLAKLISDIQFQNVSAGRHRIERQFSNKKYSPAILRGN